MDDTSRKSGAADAALLDEREVGSDSLAMKDAVDGAPVSLGAPDQSSIPSRGEGMISLMAPSNLDKENPHVETSDHLSQGETLVEATKAAASPAKKQKKKKKTKPSSKTKHEQMEELGALSSQDAFAKGDDREASRLVKLYTSGGGAKKLFLELPKAFEVAAENGVDVPMFALRLLHRVWR